MPLSYSTADLRRERTSNFCLGDSEGVLNFGVGGGGGFDEELPDKDCAGTCGQPRFYISWASISRLVLLKPKIPHGARKLYCSATYHVIPAAKYSPTWGCGILLVLATSGVRFSGRTQQPQCATTYFVS